MTNILFGVSRFAKSLPIQRVNSNCLELTSTETRALTDKKDEIARGTTSGSHVPSVRWFLAKINLQVGFAYG